MFLGFQTCSGSSLADGRHIECELIHRSQLHLYLAEAIRHLNDPEHPLTLEQLNVTAIDGIIVDNERSTGASSCTEPLSGLA